MASAIEAMGMSLPYSSSNPAEDPLKKLECRMAGRQVECKSVTAPKSNELLVTCKSVLSRVDGITAANARDKMF